MANEIKSELTVITKAKDLCSYIITITQKSPKQFRFTFVTRLQNLFPLITLTCSAILSPSW